MDERCIKSSWIHRVRWVVASRNQDQAALDGEVGGDADISMQAVAAAGESEGAKREHLQAVVIVVHVVGRSFCSVLIMADAGYSRGTPPPRPSLRRISTAPQSVKGSTDLPAIPSLPPIDLTHSTLSP